MTRPPSRIRLSAVVSLSRATPCRSGDLGEVVIVDRPQDGVAVAEGVGVAVGHAEQAVAVGGEEAALDQAALPGQGLDAVGAEDVGVGEVLAEVDAAGPVLRPGKGGRLDDGDGEAGAGQADGRASARPPRRRRRPRHSWLRNHRSSVTRPSCLSRGTEQTSPQRQQGCAALAAPPAGMLTLARSKLSQAQGSGSKRGPTRSPAGLSMPCETSSRPRSSA